jgi:hypothetical protein
MPPPEVVLGQDAGGIAEDRQLMRTGEVSKVSTVTVRDNAERELKECLCHVVIDYEYLQPRKVLVCFDVHTARQGCQVSGHFRSARLLYGGLSPRLVEFVAKQWLVNQTDQ